GVLHRGRLGWRATRPDRADRPPHAGDAGLPGAGLRSAVEGTRSVPDLPGPAPQVGTAAEGVHRAPAHRLAPRPGAAPARRRPADLDQLPEAAAVSVALVPVHAVRRHSARVPLR